MRVVQEREDKVEVDPIGCCLRSCGLVPEGGGFDQEVRKLEDTYFDTPGAGLRVSGSRCGAGSVARKRAGS